MYDQYVGWLKQKNIRSDHMMNRILFAKKNASTITDLVRGEEE